MKKQLKNTEERDKWLNLSHHRIQLTSLTMAIYVEL